MFVSHPRHRYVKEPVLDSNRCESGVNLGVQGDFKEWLKVPRTTKYTKVFTVLVELLIPPSGEPPSLGTKSQQRSTDTETAKKPNLSKWNLYPFYGMQNANSVCYAPLSTVL